MADAEGTFEIPFAARFGVRATMPVKNSATLVYFTARTGLRARSAGVFDATSGGIYITARFGLRGRCSVVSSVPVHWSALLGLRSAFTVQSASVALPPPPPVPDVMYLPGAQVLQGGAVDGAALVGGAVAAQVVLGGSEVSHA